MVGARALQVNMVCKFSCLEAAVSVGKDYKETDEQLKCEIRT